MLIVHLVAGVFVGLIAALATYMAGSGLLLSLLAYSLGGTAGLLTSVTLMLLPNWVIRRRLNTV